MSMEYSYPPSTEVGVGDNQSYTQHRRETFVHDYPSCMYDCQRVTTSRYSVLTPQTITPINNPISFAPPISHFPGNTLCEIMAAENQHQLRLYIQSLQKLLLNFAVYHFHCWLTIEVCGSYLGQTHVQMVLRNTKTGVTSYKDFTLQSHIALREQLKQAVMDLAQPLLTDLLVCPHCNIKHCKKNCMHSFPLNTNHVN